MGSDRDVIHASIVARAAAGDTAAWGQLVDHYGERLYRYARSRGLDPDTAEEVAQDCFVRVVSKLGDYVEAGRFEPWLFTIARNLVLDELRRVPRRPQAIDPEELVAISPEVPPGGEPESPISLAGLEDAMARLSEAERDLLCLRYVGGISFVEMSGVVGENVNTLLARHKRALDKLRAILGGASDGDA
ncbi:MAG: sigma-70 family RNA polymerase sigma factor [Planctomycetota bacterium]|nr:sigma-70 family RNA polymerase sigma factor [Planctomycetota bacterium]